MVDLITDPEKIATTYKDIEHIVDAVLPRMGGEAKTSCTIHNHFLSDDEFMRAATIFSDDLGYGATSEEMDYIQAFRFNPPFPKNHSLLFIRHMPVPDAFFAYMHERGHIATAEFASSKVPLQMKIVMAEMLAICFQYWACEEFDAISSRFKFHSLYQFCGTLDDFKILRKEEPHNVAYNALSEMFMAKKPRTFGSLYSILKNDLYSITEIQATGV
ncbi:MAG: hypothetical protein KJ955_03335 [Nanoarchaeota archaeon]|nr:hypothetical protein [Nanoarchaeota archaeon]